jgi:2-haloalkanoic acid dehalogenase type II
MTRLRDFSVLTFDCYGTLIDWETGIWDALQPLIHGNSDAPITRTEALGAFAELESAQQAATPAMPYPELLARVHAEFARRFQLETDAGFDAAFGGSVPHWPAFADSAEALRALGRRFRLVILSNVDRRGFEASNRKLGVDFDAVYTAEDIGSYKPDPRNFHYLRRRLEEDFGIAAGEILHTAQSLFHDHVPAQRAGLARAWIDRQQLSRGGHWGATARVPQRPEVNFTFYSLAELAAAVDNDD